MSVKNSVILMMAGLAGFAASVAVAGGVEQQQVPPAPSSYLYLEGNAGYAQSNWQNVSGFVWPFFRNINRDHDFGNGFTYGFDGGLMVNSYLGAEVGWYNLPSARGNGSGLFPFGVGGLRLNSWFAYAAGKFAAPIFRNIEVFGKIGGAYRNFTYQGVAAPLAGRSNNYWSPLFGAGAQYDWDSSWTLDAQYLHVSGYRETNRITRRAPAANLYTIGLGYKFSF